MDTHYSNLHSKIQANKPSRFEHIAAALIKIFILASVSAIFFINDNFAFGSLFAILTYGYTFYGLFIKQPKKVEPLPYIGGATWNALKSASVKSDKQKRKSRVTNAKYNSGRPNGSSSQFSNFNKDDNNLGEGNNTGLTNYMQINPATGFPMNGAIDAMGNPFGFDNSDIGNVSSFDDDFSSDSCANDDHLNTISDEF